MVRPEDERPSRAEEPDSGIDDVDIDGESDGDTDVDVDIVVVGGGPCGLACGIEARRAGLSARILEKGALTDSIRRFPVGMSFFSTSERLELGDLPFVTTAPRPTRAEVLRYYRRVTEHFALDVRLGTTVTAIRPQGAAFGIDAQRREGPQHLRARHVVVATGYFDGVRRLGVPGEEQEHVRHHYDEPFLGAHQDVVVVGGGNSAVEAALDLCRGGARVRLVHRASALKPTVKYWVRPDIEARIDEGAIPADFDTVVREIRLREVRLDPRQGGDARTVPADLVYVLIGHRPDVTLLRGAGVDVDPRTLVPHHDPQTFETNVPRLWVGGSIVSGLRTGAIFIENGRAHARSIVAAIAQRERARDGARA